MNNNRVLTGNQPRQPGVLTGNQTQGQQLGGQQPGQPQAQQTNPLAGLANLAARFAGGATGQGGTTGLYNYSNSSGSYISNMFMLDEGVAEEQLKAQALAEGGQNANSLAMILMRRVAKNQFYHCLRAAMERFKTPMKAGNQEQGLVEFVNELESNQQLYGFLCMHISMQYAAEFAMALTAGDERLRDPSNRGLAETLVYRISLDSIWMQYFDYISGHPDGNQIFYRLSHQAKEVATSLDGELFDMIQHRYTWSGQQCPWRKGRLSEMLNRSKMDNPLLDQGPVTDLGFGGMFYNANMPTMNTPGAGQNVDQAGMREMYDYINRTVVERVNRLNGMPQQQPENALPQTLYSHHDQVELRLNEITRQTRHKYRLENYATRVPNTDYWLVRDEDMCHLARVMTTEDGSPFRMLDVRCVGAVPVYKIDWQNGIFSYRLVNHNLQVFNVMETLISNPEKLLPFMYEENGVQKTTFDPLVMETTKFMHDGKVIPVGELKELEKQPNILVGNRVISMDGENEQTLNRMSILTKTHDPKNMLDAFVLPTVINREFKLENEIDMDHFYTSFMVMVKGNRTELTDTGRVLRNINSAIHEYQDSEFAEFAKGYVTTLVNRWLVECRGYAESREDKQNGNGEAYLKSGDIFADLEDFIEVLRNNDVPTLRAFLDYETNTFIRNGLEILMPRPEVVKKFEELYAKEDEYIRAAMVTAADHSIILTRDTVLFEVKKQVPPTNSNQVIVKESVNPTLFATIKKALKIVGKHYNDTPQVLIRFNNDPHGNVWVVTPSDFDPQHVYHLRHVSEQQKFCHVWPVVQ